MFLIFVVDILANSKNSKDMWQVFNLLTNKHPPVNTSTTSGISPDDLTIFAVLAVK